jgi:hypothetical protein
MVLSAVGNKVVGEMGDDPSFPGSYTSMSLLLSSSDQSSSFARRGLLELDLELDSGDIVGEGVAGNSVPGGPEA